MVDAKGIKNHYLPTESLRKNRGYLLSSLLSKPTAILITCLLILSTLSVGATSSDVVRINGKILFHSDRDGNQEIYVMNPDGSGQTRLTNNIYSDETGGWSPDGTKIVFSSNRDGNYEIYVMNADGSGQTRLTTNNYDDKWPLWSPDGAKIAFSRDLGGNWEIFIMNSDGSGQTRLTDNGTLFDSASSWHPDGSKILFLSHRDGDFDIYIMNIDGSEQKILTNNSYGEELPAFSPDGSKIVFSNGSGGSFEIYVMNADGSEQTRLTNNNYDDYHNCWSPDGSKIAFLSERDGNTEIYVMNADGSGQTRLTSNNASDVIYGSSWQSLYLTKFKQVEPRINGKILFHSDRDGNQEIYVMNPDGSGQTRLTNNNYSDEMANWSPDGTKIVFSSNRDGNYEIYVMNADGSGQTRLTTNNYNDKWPLWSPDRTKIVFSSNRDGNYEIYVMNSDGSGQTRLTSNNYDDFHNSWSPDGTKIAFLSKRDGNFEIYVMNPYGFEQTRLTNNNYEEGPVSWSPDGAKIVFVSNRDGNYEIYVMNSDGSGQTRLTSNNYDDFHNSWSPDGTKIAFVSSRDGNNEIYVMNADGSGQTRLTINNASDVICGSAWQSLPRASVTLSLQSSTTNTIVDTDFSLDAALSVPRSGTVTLYWSIDNSGFTYKQNVTMTNGKYGRSFGASTPGTWAFKVMWAGDKEYKGAESNIVTVTVKPIPVLTSAVTASPTSIYSGGTAKIKVSLTSEGTAVKGASVSLSSSTGGMFSVVTDHGNGTYVATYTAPDVIAQTQYSITALANKSGYISASGQTQVMVKPLVLNFYVKTGDGAPVVGAAVVSTSQPIGQSALSGSTDASGLVVFTGVLKGSYTIKASKSGFDDKTGTLTIQQSQASSETFTLVKQPSPGGIPGYPLLSVVLALLATTIILHQVKYNTSAKTATKHKCN